MTTTYTQKITFGEMRESGVREVLIGRGQGLAFGVVIPLLS